MHAAFDRCPSPSHAESRNLFLGLSVNSPPSVSKTSPQQPIGIHSVMPGRKSEDIQLRRPNPAALESVVVLPIRAGVGPIHGLSIIMREYKHLEAVDLDLGLPPTQFVNHLQTEHNFFPNISLDEILGPLKSVANPQQNQDFHLKSRANITPILDAHLFLKIVCRHGSFQDLTPYVYPL